MFQNPKKTTKNKNKPELKKNKKNQKKTTKQTKQKQYFVIMRYNISTSKRSMLS
jgi:hypothetical protein